MKKTVYKVKFIKYNEHNIYSWESKGCHLEENINEFLEKNPNIRIQDIKIDSTGFSYAMIIYSEVIDTK